MHHHTNHKAAAWLSAALCAVLLAIPAFATAGETTGGAGGTANGTAGGASSRDSGLIVSEQAEPDNPAYSGAGTDAGRNGNGTGSRTANENSRTITGRSASSSAASGARNADGGVPDAISDTSGMTGTTGTDDEGHVTSTADGAGSAVGEAVRDTANAAANTVKSAARWHPLALLALIAAIVLLTVATRKRMAKN